MSQQPDNIVSKITAYIMAKNEQSNIENAIKSLQWCDQVIVADTGSTDKTVELANRAGATVIKVDFKGFGATRNEILKKIDSEWVVCLDADEICTPDLALELKEEIQSNRYDAFKAPRLTFLLGRPIRHSGWYPDYRHPIAFRRTRGKYDEKEVHETLMVEGETKPLSNQILHYSIKDLSSYLSKLFLYTELGAKELAKNKTQKLSRTKAVTHGLFRFFRHYFFKLGFLDGWPGLVIAVCSSYGAFMKYSRALELREK